MDNKYKIVIPLDKKERDLTIKALNIVSEEHYKLNILKGNLDVSITDYIINEMVKNKILKNRNIKYNLYNIEIYFFELNVLLFALYYYVPYINNTYDERILIDIINMILCESEGELKEKSKEFIRIKKVIDIDRFIYSIIKQYKIKRAIS